MTTETKTPRKPKPEFAIRMLVTQNREPTVAQVKQHLLDNPGCKGPTHARATLRNRVEKLQYSLGGDWIDVETVVVEREETHE